jgi:hypothetical protein
MASGGGQSGKAAGENRGDGRIGAGHNETIGPECGKPHRPGRESNQACGGRKAGKVRRRHLRGKGDGGERQPSGKVMAQIPYHVAGGRQDEITCSQDPPLR